MGATGRLGATAQFAHGIESLEFRHSEQCIMKLVDLQAKNF